VTHSDAQGAILLPVEPKALLRSVVTKLPVALPGPCPFASRRFSVADRLVVHEWMMAAITVYGRSVLERAEGLGHADPGEYLLIYRRDNVWASWGIGCGIDGYLLWESIRGATVGIFPALRAALAEIIALS